MQTLVTECLISGAHTQKNLSACPRKPIRFSHLCYARTIRSSLERGDENVLTLLHRFKASIHPKRLFVNTMRQDFLAHCHAKVLTLYIDYAIIKSAQTGYLRKNIHWEEFAVMYQCFRFSDVADSRYCFTFARYEAGRFFMGADCSTVRK